MEEHDGGEYQRRLPGVEPIIKLLVGVFSSHLIEPRIVPNIVAIPFQDQQDDGADRWEGQIRQAGLVVKPEAQAGVELADLGGRIRTGHCAAAAAATNSSRGARVAAGVPSRRLAVEASPAAMGLGVLQRRGAAGSGGGGEGAAGVGRGSRGGVVVGGGDAAMLWRGGLIGGEVHGFSLEEGGSWGGRKKI